MYPDTITKSQKDIIWAFARLAEYRDETTGLHLERVMLFSEIIAVELKRRQQFQQFLTNERIKQITYAAILHDVGKIGISDTILNKPDKLSIQEFDLLKTHTIVGRNAIYSIKDAIKNDELIELMQDVIFCHHENYNGSGYPAGLKGYEIPVSAQIVAIADVYDAIRSKRPYKENMTHKEAYDLILKDEKVKFSPDVIEAFVSVNKMFGKIYDYLISRNQQNYTIIH